MPKSWIYEPMLSAYDALLFYNAMRRHCDSFYYTPVAVAKREEAGIKYRFLCLAYNKNTPSQDSQFASVEIYKPNSGMPYATRLHMLSQDVWL